MIAFSAGGRRAATCSALKPPQEMPIMPDRRRCTRAARAIQAITSSASSCSCLRYSSSSSAVGLARAAHVDAHAGIAVAGELGMDQLVARARCRRACGRGCTRGSPAPAAPPGVRRQPDARREPRPVGQRDPDVLDLAHRARKVSGSPSSLPRNSVTLPPRERCALAAPPHIEEGRRRGPDRRPSSDEEGQLAAARAGW